MTTIDNFYCHWAFRNYQWQQVTTFILSLSLTKQPVTTFPRFYLVPKCFERASDNKWQLLYCHWAFRNNQWQQVTTFYYNWALRNNQWQHFHTSILSQSALKEPATTIDNFYIVTELYKRASNNNQHLLYCRWALWKNQWQQLTTFILSLSL